MKKSLTYSCLLAALVAVGCAKSPEAEVLPAEAENGRTVLYAQLSPETKATGTKVASFLWASTDKIDVWDGTSFNEFTLQSGAGEASAAFSGTVAADPTLAVYPAIGKAIDGDNVTITLPDEYAYSLRGIEMPMVAGISSQTDPLSFQHLGAIIKFDVYGIPAAADRFVFTATGKNITGDFTFDSSAATPAIVTADGSNSSITITFTPGSMTSGSFYVPVPTGTYGSGFSVALKNGDETLISKTRTSSITLSRAQFLIQPAFDCGSKTSNEIWSGSFDPGNWTSRLDLRSAATWSEVSAGTKLVLTFSPDATDGNEPANSLSRWQLKVEDGWQGELPDPIRIHIVSGQTEASVALSAENLALITERGGIYITGSYVTITSVTLEKDTREFRENVWRIWNNAASYLETPNAYTTHNDLAWGSFDWSKIAAGSVLRLGFTLNAEPTYNNWWALSFGKGDGWGALTEPIDLSFSSFETSVDVTLTQNNLDCINANHGLVIAGTDVCLTYIDLVTTMQEASKTVIWTGTWTCTSWDYITDLMNEKYNWSGMSGKTVRFFLTPSANAQFAVKHTGTGWPALTDHPNQNVPIYKNYVDITITDNDIDEINTNGGIIVSGQNYTLTEVSVLN